jgi:NAD(P)-dependent dehydrogenase (short-subunit alcohol dehydrogenase family)
VQLNNKVAVVLGASSSGGTGWAVAEKLASEGAKVVVAARRIAPLEELAEKIDGIAVACDAGSEAQVAALTRTAEEAFGKIDIAVNCAFASGLGMIDDLDDATLRGSVDVNFIGQVYFVRHAARSMADGGSIVLMSSEAAAQPLFGGFAYGCAKAATDSLVRHAALEYGPRGIRVNSILPGPIVVERNAGYMTRPEITEAFLQKIPLGRLGEPADFAQIVVWLAQAHLITGVNLRASGGMQLSGPPRLDRISDSWQGEYESE